MATAADDFNRADAGTLGANWTDQKGSIDLVSNQAKTVTSSEEYSYYSGSFAADQYSQAVAAGVSTNPVLGVTVRASAASPSANFYGLLLRGTGGGALGLYKVVNGSTTQLESIAQTLAVNDTAKIVAQGNRIKGYKNGAQIGSDQSDAGIATGNPGLYISQNAGLNAIWDNWEGGDFAELQVLLGDPMIGSSLF
jgi:hypothetical protein